MSCANYKELGLTMRPEKKISIAVVIFGLGFLGGFLTLADFQNTHPLFTYVAVITMFLLSLIFAYKKID